MMRLPSSFVINLSLFCIYVDVSGAPGVKPNATGPRIKYNLLLRFTPWRRDEKGPTGTAGLRLC
jgi:hypothetical protein